MIKFYGTPYRSASSGKVHWTLEEAGVSYSFHPIDILTGEQRRPEFLAVNPNGKIPALDDEGFLLWDSTAIIWYVADNYARGRLVPNDPRQRALVHQWVAWQAADFGPAASKPWYLTFLAGSLYPPFDASTHALACEAVQPLLRILDDQLRGRNYLVGDALTIADIAVAEFTSFGVEGGMPLGGHPNVQAWFERVTARPACVATRALPPGQSAPNER